MSKAINTGVINRTRITQSSYRKAVSKTVAAHRNGYSDQDFSDIWGVSAGTVNNAQNLKKDLTAIPLLKLGERFGPDGLNTVLALIGMKAVHDTDVTIDVENVPCDIASVLPLLIELFRDGECCDGDVRKLDDAGAIDKICELADYLRQRRNGVRLDGLAAVG